MDDVQQNDSERRRKSTRSAVRKVPLSKSDTSGKSSDDVSADISKKRKRSEKTPPRARKQNRKKVVAFKCCPLMLAKLLKRLDNDQKKWVEDLGFGALLLMPEVRLPKKLVLWLIDQVDWKKKALIIRGRAFKLSKWIKKVLTIPNGELKVPLPRGGRGKTKIRNPTEEELEFTAAEGGRGVGVQDIIDELVSIHEPVKFKRSFMLVLLCIYLAPTSGHVINRNYVPSLSNIELISEMDWCEYVVNYLIDGIRDYRDSRAANVNVHGCVHILPLIYIDIVSSALLKVPAGLPRANVITTNLFELLQSADLKTDSKGRETYGKLPLKEEYTSDDNVEEEQGKVRREQNDAHGTVPASPDLHSNAGKVNENHQQRSELEGTDQNKCGLPVGKDQLRRVIRKIEKKYDRRREKLYAKWVDQLKEDVSKVETKRAAAIARAIDQFSSGMPRVSSVDCEQGGSDNRRCLDGGLPTVDGSKGNGSTSKVRSAQGLLSDPCSQKSSQHFEPREDAREVQEARSNGSDGTVSENTPIPGTNTEVANRTDTNGQELLFENTTTINHSNSTVPDLVNKSRQDSMSSGDVVPTVNSSSVPVTEELAQAPIQQFDPGGLPTQNGSPVQVTAGKPATSEAAQHLYIEYNTSSSITRDEGEPSDAAAPKDVSLDEVLVLVNQIGQEASMEADIVAANEMLQDKVNEMPASNHAASGSENVQLLTHQDAIADQPTPPTPHPPMMNEADIQLAVSEPEGQNLHNDASNVSRLNEESINLAVSHPEGHNLQNDASNMSSPTEITNQVSASESLEQQNQEEEKNSNDKAEEVEVSQVDAESNYNVNSSCPTYTLDELRIIDIPDSPPLSTPSDTRKLPSLRTAIVNGRRFVDAGSVNTAVKSRPKRHMAVEGNIDGISECVRAPSTDKAAVCKTYTDHVENSRFRSSRRNKNKSIDVSDDGGPKVSIRDFHVTEKEFVNALVPNGHVDLNFMWLCCVAIMEDWGSRTKFILNQPIIKELMRPFNECDHEDCIKRLRKIPFQEVEHV